MSLTLPFNLHIQKAVGPTGLCQEVNIRQSLSPFCELQGPQKKGSPSSLQVRFFSGIYIYHFWGENSSESLCTILLFLADVQGDGAYHYGLWAASWWTAGKWEMAPTCITLQPRKTTHPQNPILLSWQMVLNSSVPLCSCWTLLGNVS